MPEEFFRIRNVKKAFGKHVVLGGVNLDVQKGEVLGIIGTSGSGKTTLLHTLIGFLKPDCGEVRILVEPPHRALGNPTYKDVHKNLNIVKSIYGFASQIPSFYDNLTVEENLGYFASLYQMPHRNIETNREILLHLMDLDPAKKLLAKDLSGGMERRLDIACALIHDPAVLILDEPTADLDPVLRSHIYDLIKQINNKNTTIILASHHLSDLEAVCDRIAILKEGKILAVGTPDEIKNQFAKYHQVDVRVASRRYDVIYQELKKKQLHKIVDRVEPTNQGVLMYTQRPDILVKEIVTIVDKAKDKIEQLHVSRPSLDDIFVSIVGDKTAEEFAKSKRGIEQDEVDEKNVIIDGSSEKTKKKPTKKKKPIHHHVKHVVKKASDHVKKVHKKMTSPKKKTKKSSEESKEDTKKTDEQDKKSEKKEESKEEDSPKKEEEKKTGGEK